MVVEKNIKKVMISGGGTGGHIFPAIAIAHALREVDSSIEFLFVGAKGKMEMEKVPEAGFSIKGLWISGLQRRLTWKNLLFPIKLLSSIFKCKQLIRQFQPDVVVGVGGYASGPLCYVAAKTAIPVVIQEQNSFPGITNKVLGKRAEKICVAYENMERFFPKEKIVLTGNPVRKELLAKIPSKDNAAAHFGLNPDKNVVLSIGGSLGSRTINQSIGSKIDELVNSGHQLIWQTGKGYYEAYKHFEEKYTGQVKVMPFIKDMDKAYGVADIIISRAGAIAISELSLIGKPVVLVPSPNVAEDHQTKNALALANENAAKMIKDSDSIAQLVPQVLDLLKNEEERKKMGQQISQRAKPGAAENIATEILALINYQV